MFRVKTKKDMGNKLIKRIEAKHKQVLKLYDAVESRLDDSDGEKLLSCRRLAVDAFKDHMSFLYNLKLLTEKPTSKLISYNSRHNFKTGIEEDRQQLNDYLLVASYTISNQREAILAQQGITKSLDAIGDAMELAAHAQNDISTAISSKKFYKSY